MLKPTDVLNPAQQEAINHVSGPMLLLAGPGSGKTRVITERIKNLITRHHVSPQKILVITFTKAAAIEMQNRSIALCDEASQVAFGTFHSFFYHILKQSKQYQKLIPMTQTEKEKMLYEIGRLYLRAFSSKETELERMISDIAALLTYCKNTGEDILAIDDERKEVLYKKAKIAMPAAYVSGQYIKVMQAYQKECYLQQKIDFDDMLYLCKQLFSQDSAQKNKWQDRFSYIMIDEFQDINQIQYELVRILTEKQANIFVVGDDDQAIYGFRGSDPKFMKQFEQDFYACKRLLLGMNYRSTEQILQMSAKFITKNKNRYEKQLFSCNETKGTFCMQAFSAYTQEVLYYDSYIKNRIEHNPNETIAILFRTNRELMQFEKQIPKSLLKLCAHNRKQDIYFDKEIALDILAMLHMMTGERNRAYFFRFMNKPDRGIHRISVTDPVSFDALLAIYQAEEKTACYLRKIKMQLEMAAQLDAYGAILFCLNVMEYDVYLSSLPIERKKLAQKTIEAMKNIAMQFKDCRHYLQTMDEKMEAYICDEMKINAADKESEEGDKIGKLQIHFMTYHASKGLEFDTVILPGVMRGKVPHGRMLSEEELEEERRMFYVAMTRAKKNLCISYVEDAQAKNSVSVFVADLLALQ